MATTLVHPYPFHIGNMLSLSLSNSCAAKPPFVHKPIAEETPSPTAPLFTSKIESPGAEIPPRQFPAPLSQQVSSVTKRTRRKRCGTCPGCLRKPEDKCGICSACMHPNNSQICRKRRCESLKRPPKVCISEKQLAYTGMNAHVQTYRPCGLCIILILFPVHFHCCSFLLSC